MKERLEKYKELLLLLPAIGLLTLAVVSTQINRFSFESWPDASAVVTAQAAQASNETDTTVTAKKTTTKKNSKTKDTKKASSADTSVKSGTWKDGEYTGSGKGFGGNITVKVTIKNGKITAVTVVSAPGETASFLSKAKGLIPSILSKQSPNVDGISGATYSSNGIKTAVANALNQAVTDEKDKITADTDSEDNTNTNNNTNSKKNSGGSAKVKEGTWKDGVYEGSGTGFGGPINVKVTIKNGKITAVKIVSAAKETPQFLNKAKGLIPSILKKQSPNVDGISGATYSSNGIKAAVTNALNKAVTNKKNKITTSDDKDKKSDDSKNTDNNNKKKSTDSDKKKTTDETATDTKPKDGTYTASATCERYRYTMTMNFKFKNGKLVSISGLKVSEDSDSPNAAFWTMAYKPMVKNLLSAQSADVDTVSGATYSSNAIVEAYKKAYKAAVNANKKTSTKDTEEEETESAQETNTSDESTETDQGNDNQNGSEEESESAEESGNATETEDTRPVIAGVKDGTYTVSTTVWPDEWEDFYEYDLSASFTFENQRLTNITINSLSDKTNLFYCNMALTKGSGKVSGILTQLLEKQSAEGISTVSGATCSSTAFKELFNKAVEEAKR